MMDRKQYFSRVRSLSKGVEAFLFKNDGHPFYIFRLGVADIGSGRFTELVARFTSHTDPVRRLYLNLPHRVLLDTVRRESFFFSYIYSDVIPLDVWDGISSFLPVVGNRRYFLVGRFDSGLVGFWLEDAKSVEKKSITEGIGQKSMHWVRLDVKAVLPLDRFIATNLASDDFWRDTNITEKVKKAQIFFF